MRENEEKERLIPITVRFSPDGYAALSELSEKYNLSKGEIARIAIDDRLISYLGKVAFADPEDGAKIRKETAKISTEMERIRLELNRIGVNFNQLVRLLNTQAKSGTHVLKNGDAEVAAGKDVVTGDEMENLMMRFEQSAIKISNAFSLIAAV